MEIVDCRMMEWMNRRDGDCEDGDGLWVRGKEKGKGRWSDELESAT